MYPPPHSYELSGELTAVSAFGSYQLPMDVRRLYHPCVVSWIKRAETLARGRDLGVVAAIVREDFDQSLEKALQGREWPWPDGPIHAWRCFIDGSWTLCLKDITAENILGKECCRATIRDSPDRDADIEQLEKAVRDYASATLPFSPHEVAESSRFREVEPAIKKYGLSPLMD